MLLDSDTTKGKTFQQLHQAHNRAVIANAVKKIPKISTHDKLFRRKATMLFFIGRNARPIKENIVLLHFHTASADCLQYENVIDCTH